MDLELKDKVAVITGGSVGIGLAVAEAFAREGVHFALCARQEDRLTQCAHELLMTGDQALCFPGRGSKSDCVSRLPAGKL